MAKDNALFEDDFDLDFDREFGLDNDQPAAASIDNQVSAVDTDAPYKSVETFNGADRASMEGGDREIPAIAVMAFCERSATEAIVKAVAEDRRMARATVEIRGNGIPAAIEYLAANPTPNLLIVESSAPAATMIEQIDRLAEHCDEGIRVMVIGATNDISLYRQLMARGVSEYLVPPIKPVQVVRSIGTLFTDPDAPFVGKSISVVGAKGGVGASTIAHNLAWSLAENARVNTTLVDLDLSFGTTALDFNHESQQSVADALLNPDRADDAVISRLLTKATDRLSLFTAPASVNQIMDIPSDAYSTVIQGVRRLMPYVVLDIPHGWNEWVYNTLVASDEVIIVCQPDLASLRNGKNMIDQIRSQTPGDPGQGFCRRNRRRARDRPELRSSAVRHGLQ